MTDTTTDDLNTLMHGAGVSLPPMEDELVVEEEAPETDFDSHHIEGYVNNSYLSVPLISHIEGNLWTGGCIGGVKLPEDFQYVVSLYPWEQYDLPHWTTRIEAKMYDSGAKPDSVLVKSLGALVANLMHEGKTLVHCQAGLNRSGLIGALALIYGTDRTPEEAIALLREKRSSLVLCNDTFANWILSEAVDR